MCGSKIDIVPENATSSYRARKDRPDCIVHGLQCEEGKKKKMRQSDVSA